MLYFFMNVQIRQMKSKELDRELKSYHKLTLLLN